MSKVLPILIAVVAAEAFGLSYQGYNKYLFDEFESVNNNVILSRHRRGTELLCCTGDKINYAMVEKITQIQKGCFSEYEKSNKRYSNDSSVVSEFVICVNECIFRKLDIMDRNGKFNRGEAIKFYALTEVGEIKWKKAAFAGYVDACITMVESTPKATDKKCSMAGLDFGTCILGKFIGGCPADLRIDSEVCNADRKMFADMNLLSGKS